MTSLIAWIAADSRGQSSINIATDSRISWNASRRADREHWDQTQKVFAARNLPILMGYVGDITFPALALPQLLARLDRGITRAGTSPAIELQTGIRTLARDFPSLGSFTVYIAHREGYLMRSNFRLSKLSHNADVVFSRRWVYEDVPVPTTSSPIVIDGSGKSAVQRISEAWRAEGKDWTSRAISSGFIDSIIEGEDWRSGGAPQWGTINRRGAGQLLGIIHQDRRFFAGGRLVGEEGLGDVSWRNALSERTDGTSKRRLPGAQPQPRPGRSASTAPHDQRST